MLKIRWKEKVTNIEVLTRMKAKMKFCSNIIIYKLTFAGHVVRGSSGKLILAVLEGKIKGKKYQRRSEKTT